MAKNTNNARRTSQPSPMTDPNVVSSGAGSSQNPAAPAEHVSVENVVPISVTSKRPNAFLDGANSLSKELQDKVQHVGQARQILALASDLYREGTSRHDEAVETANKAMLTLYRDRVSGIVSADEVTGILGDIFGYKAKKDGTPSKTPDALGEVLRKRIVRAVAAHDYVKSDPANRDDGEAEPETDGGAFFKGLPTSDVYGLVSNIGDEFNLWTFYDATAQLKKDHTNRVAAAFDPKRMAALADTLNVPDAAIRILDVPGLKAAYTGLIETLLMIGEEMAVIEKDREAAKAA